MNIITKPFNLVDDKWSLTKPLFGKNNQIKVLGKLSGTEYYIVSCYICSADREMFQDGTFLALKDKLLRGQCPCGCSPSPQWNEDQLLTIASRTAELGGIEFLGLNSEFKGLNSFIDLSCPTHGIWSTTKLNSLIHTKTGCPKCAQRKRVEPIIVPEKVQIERFKDSGYFPEGTVFSRLDKKTRLNSYLWYVLCGTCNEQTEASTVSLQQGRLYCSCGKNRKTQAYVNLVSDAELPIAVKFGISRDSSNRRKTQSYNSVFEITSYAVYQFADSLSCLSAERECRDSFYCGVIPKSDMRDGHTETTYLYNLDTILKIYKRHGGVQIET